MNFNELAVYTYSVDELRELLRQNGFVVEKEEAYVGYVRDEKGDEKAHYVLFVARYKGLPLDAK